MCESQNRISCLTRRRNGQGEEGEGRKSNVQEGKRRLGHRPRPDQMTWPALTSLLTPHSLTLTHAWPGVHPGSRTYGFSLMLTTVCLLLREPSRAAPSLPKFDADPQHLPITISGSELHLSLLADRTIAASCLEPHRFSMSSTHSQGLAMSSSRILRLVVSSLPLVTPRLHRHRPL